MIINRRIGRVLTVPTISIFLLVLRARAALQHHAPLSRNNQVSREILEGLQSTPSAKSAAADAKNNAQGAARAGTSPRSLDLETDFYDAGTGLHSEGVWHNCMAGIASLRLSRRAHHPPRGGRDDRHHDDAARIADSLFRSSWDGVSFRRRAWSGSWDHSRLRRGDAGGVVQPNYYEESSEHRCIQHATALAFWSMLAQDSGKDANNSNHANIRSQQSLIARQFVDEFWNGRRWTTVGRSQGYGTTLRPSASSGVVRTETSSPETPYFRAVDQAVAVLACLQHIQLLDDEADGRNKAGNREERETFNRIVRTTCRDLLDDKDGFGYDNLSNARTYLGLDRNRNFWHEGWVMLALTLARDNVWPMDAQEGNLHILWNGLMERYTSAATNPKENNDAGRTIWHWPVLEKDLQSNVRYCGDNVLAYAIRRNMRCQPMAGKMNNGDRNADDDAFWSFVDMLRSENKEGSDNEHHLASVADVYPQVRLHPNTELAALLVWPP